MLNNHTVSVIIPTFNRKQFLIDTLDSLSGQNWDWEGCEVLVVDDGSEPKLTLESNLDFPFELRILRQANQGDAAARNFGVAESKGSLLVFLDDDILVDPEYLRHLIAGHENKTKRLVVGTAFLLLEHQQPRIGEATHPAGAAVGLDLVPIGFQEVCSNNMSIHRKDYEAVGGMRWLDFPGSSIWCDVEFSYRAHLRGFEFLRSQEAICWHRDYVSASLDNQKNRMREAAFRAAALFQWHPDLVEHLDMFTDKAPIRLGQDSVGLIGRKLVRRFSASGPSLWILDRLAALAQTAVPKSAVVRTLRRWIIGGNIYRGFYEGLAERDNITA